MSRFLLLVFVFTVLVLSACSSTPDAGAPDVEERVATVEVEPTADLPEPTETAAPTDTVQPPATTGPADEPTQPPVRAATALAATVAASQLTAVPPTATGLPASTATVIQPTAAPPTEPATAAPQATVTLSAAAGVLSIIGVDKSAEVVTIRNDGGSDVDLAGWVLRSEKGLQDCALGGVIGPGQVLQIWAMAEDAGMGGYNCGFDSNIWNNSESDPAVLINPSGAEVSRW